MKSRIASVIQLKLGICYTYKRLATSIPHFIAAKLNTSQTFFKDETTKPDSHFLHNKTEEIAF